MWDLFGDSVADATFYAGCLGAVALVATTWWGRRREPAPGSDAEAESRASLVEAVVEENEELRRRLDEGGAERDKLRAQVGRLQRRLGRVEGKVLTQVEGVASMERTIASMERTVSRLRHALSNVCQDAAAVRRLARAGGLTIPAFPLGSLMELEDDEYGAHLREAMRDS